MIKVLNPGLWTSVQDLGRLAGKAWGVPFSGVMDTISARFANLILGNDPSDALLEFTLLGPTLEFQKNTNIVIVGAEFNPKLNDAPIQNDKSYPIKKGDILSMGNARKGVRCYLGVLGGIQSKKIFGSRSFSQAVTSAHSVKTSDIIPYNETRAKKNLNTKIKWSKDHFHQQEIRAIKGPEFHLFDQNLITEYSTGSFFSIAKENNRMAIQLNESLPSHSHSILTRPVLPGSVQYTPSGRLIVLMRDAQTTGGYPRIFQIDEPSICALAQKNTNDNIRFRLRDLYENL